MDEYLQLVGHFDSVPSLNKMVECSWCQSLTFLP